LCSRLIHHLGDTFEDRFGWLEQQLIDQHSEHLPLADG